MPIDSDLPALLSRLGSTRRPEKEQAAQELRRQRGRHERELLEVLRQKESNPLKEPVLGVVMEAMTSDRLKKLSFILRHPDTKLREEFARRVGELGTIWALPFLARMLKDPERWVRQMAAIGLRNRAHLGFTEEFARRASVLLLRYIKAYPDDKGAPRYDALKAFAPEKHARLEAERDKGDALSPVIRTIFETAERSRSYKAALAAFETAPVAHRYVFALNYVDADIRNGGISQLHWNSTWQLMPDAIEGARTFEFPRLAAILKEIVFYYHRDGRSKLKRRIPAAFFADLPSDWHRTLGELEDEYYKCFARQRIADISEVWRRAFDKHPSLFASRR